MIVGWGIVEEGNPMSRNREVKKYRKENLGRKEVCSCGKTQESRTRYFMRTNLVN